MELNEVIERCLLDDLELVKEYGEYYLSAKYVLDTNIAKHKLYVPRIKLEIKQDDVEIQTVNEIDQRSGFTCRYDRHYIDIGLGKKLLLRSYTDIDTNETYHYKIEKLEDKVKEMTVDEIEKKLGYKIKIVSEENNGL